MKKIRFFWKELLSTFWFIPVMLIVLSILMSIVFVSIDREISIPEDYWFRFFLVTDPNSARGILSTISGAMIGVAGTVFSVTLVALTLASSQFGPRLIKNFMYVKLNQVVLGLYIATYLYCLLVLNSVKDNEGYDFIPSISILIAIFVAIGNIVLLIIFIHQIATSIQADRVISDISVFITNQLETLYPENIGEENDGKEEVIIDPVISSYPKSVSIKSPVSGYLQYISSDRLFELLVKMDSLLIIHHRPGSFLVQGIEIAELQCKFKWEKEKIDSLVRQFIVGKTKTPQQDLEYSIHQMVEIAVRALSPGINDPYTAISCIDNLTSTMSHLARSKFPSKYRLDKDGIPRIIAKTFDFDGVLDASFNQIRQFSVGSTAVIIRLMEGLLTIMKFTNTNEQKTAVRRHARMVLNVGEQSINETEDLNDLKKRAYKILK
jgi:uncharacterized membrane protein